MRPGGSGSRIARKPLFISSDVRCVVVQVRAPFGRTRVSRPSCACLCGAAARDPRSDVGAPASHVIERGGMCCHFSVDRRLSLVHDPVSSTFSYCHQSLSPCAILQPGTSLYNPIIIRTGCSLPAKARRTLCETHPSAAQASSGRLEHVACEDGECRNDDRSAHEAPYRDRLRRVAEQGVRDENENDRHQPTDGRDDGAPYAEQDLSNISNSC
jgi:hypothetical protein